MLPFRDDSLEVTLADDVEEICSTLLHVARVKHAPARRHDPLELALAFDQRQAAEIASV